MEIFIERDHAKGFDDLRRMPTTMRYFNDKGEILDTLDEREIQKQRVPYYAVRFHYTTHGNRSHDAKQYLYYDKDQRPLTLHMVPPRGDYADIEGYPFAVDRIWNYGQLQA